MAIFSTKFLKEGSYLDLLTTTRVGLHRQGIAAADAAAGDWSDGGSGCCSGQGSEGYCCD